MQCEEASSEYVMPPDPKSWVWISKLPSPQAKQEDQPFGHSKTVRPLELRVQCVCKRPEYVGIVPEPKSVDEESASGSMFVRVCMFT